MQHHSFNQSIKPLLLASLMAATLALGAPSQFVSADSTTIDFEGYTLGNPNGQNGWVFTGPYDVAIASNTSGASSLGAKSLRISNAITSGSFGDWVFSKPLADEAGETSASNDGYSGGTRQPYFEVQFDLASAVPAAEQPGLQFSTAADRGDGARMTFLRFNDTPSGLQVTFADYQQSANDFVTTIIASGLDRAVPHRIRMTVQFVDGVANDIVKVYIDGSLVHTGTTWEDYFRDGESVATRTVDSMLFQARSGAGTAPATSGAGFLIDNLTLFSGPVPVPPCTTTCYVDAVNGNDSNDGASIGTAFKTIQKAIDTVQAGGTVRVLPGSYSETATNRFVIGTNGPHQFGLYVGPDKNGISIIGVDGTDAPIMIAANAVAAITTNATNNFGSSGIFVEGDNVTLQGLQILNNLPDDNKTIEIIGDGFTLKHTWINVPGGGSVYFGDWRYDTGTSTAHIQSYDVENNIFDQGTQVAISNGAGASGPVTSRKILNNVFLPASGQNWPGISFNGAGGVPWYTLPVGGAVIAGNTFSGSTQHIRSRGTVNATEFDWASYWNNNTYDKAVVALVTELPFDVRSFSYTSAPYTFTNVRRIGAVIQQEVDNAQAGDTVLVKAGTYPETVTINKVLTLKGAQAGVLAKGRPGPESIIRNSAGSVVPLDVQADNVTIDGFTFDSTGLIAVPWTITAINELGNGRFAGLKVLNNTFVGNPNVSNNPAGVYPGGMYVWNADDALIEGNYFNALGQHAVFMGNTSTNTIYRNNDSFQNYNSNFSAHTGPHTGVLIENNRMVEDTAILFKIDGLTARNNVLTSSATTSARFFLGGGSNNILIEKNTWNSTRNAPVIIYDAGWGYGPNSNATVQDNVLNARPDYVDQTVGTTLIDLRDVGGTNLIARNTIHYGANYTGAVHGIGVRGNMGSVTISENELNGGNNDTDASTSSAGIILRSTLAATSVVNVLNNKVTGFVNGVEVQQLAAGVTAKFNLNSLAGNSANGLLNGTTLVDGEKNWWGNANGPSNAGNPGGTGAVVAGNVDYDPWLCDGTDTSPSVGFQPNPNTLCSVPGAISLTKVVDWDGAAVNNAQTFQLCVSGGSLASPICQNFGANGGTQTVSGLQPGNYTVSEADPGNAWTVTGNNATVVVASNVTASGTITNQLKRGSIDITKVVNWSGVAVDNSQTFSICLSGPSFATPDCKSFGANGGTQTWSNLISGNYTVNEADPGANWDVSGNNATLVLNAGSSASASITNTFRAASLTVTKTVNWNGAPPAAGVNFQICVTGPSFSTPNCKTFTPGQAQTWSPLIPGNYTVNETDPGANWTVTGNNAVVNVAPAQAATARIINVLRPGTLQVVKVVNTNGAPGLSQTFSICVTGPSFAAPDCKTVGIAGGTLQWSPVVPGNYSVVETAPGPNWNVAGNNATVTVNPAQTGSTTITNTYADVSFACSVLDNFNRANGKLGSNWAGDASVYRVKDKTAYLNDDWGDIILWNRAPATFGANQYACLTLTKIATSSEKHALILKAQGTDARTGMIKVAYVPKYKRVDVWSIQPGQGWVKRATISNVTFVNGDKFGARAYADGSVRVYKNGALIGSSQTSSYFVNRSGRIGVWFVNAEGARFDDFGGGNFTP